MPAPDAQAIKDFIYLQAQLWSDKTQKQAFLQAYRDIAPGGCRIEPWIGRGLRDGLPFLEKIWDGAAQVFAKVQSVTVNANEAAAVVYNYGVRDGQPVHYQSVEIYRFNDDGTLDIRYFH